MSSPMVRMLAELDARVQADYEESTEAAAADPQQAGHLAESTWSRVLQEWLPTGYSVTARRYITPETNEDAFETDLVVFRPIVPEVVGGRRGCLMVRSRLRSPSVEQPIEPVSVMQ